jgi:hypothetical protein
MSINLPSVIQSVIQLAENKADEQPNLPVNNSSKIVICLSKSLSKDDLKLLQYYGQVEEYSHSIHNNVELDKIDFDYLLLDLRKPEDRLYVQKHVLNNLQKINLVLFRYSFEGDNGISYNVERTELPSKQISKKVFDELLLSRQLEAPSCIISLLRALVCAS